MSEQRQRQNAIKFRVMPAENERIHTAAKREGYPVAGFARHAILAAADGKHLELPGAKAKALRNLRLKSRELEL